MGGPNLTAAEAAARAAVVDVDRYDIAVDLTGMVEGERLRTTSTITFTAAEGAATFVECAATVESATLNGRSVPSQDVGEHRIRLDDLERENVLEVVAHQDATGKRAGVHRVVDPVDDEVYVWMAFEPYDAHRAWACFDQPDLKAPHALTVTAPAQWRVVSNRAADLVETLDEDTRRWTFPDTPPLSTYVVTIDAGPFHEIRRETADRSMGILCQRSRSEIYDREAPGLLDLTEAGLAFFGDRFGAHFPQRHYEQVFVNDMPGAFEAWGCVVYGDDLVQATPTYGDRALLAEVVLHEMAHMWFGDLVTMRWWDDLWLNEAFASWAATWALERLDDRHATRWAEFALDRKLRARAQDRGPASHPISQPVPDTSSAFASFDLITYSKGQAALKQLVAFVGQDVFEAGLVDHFARHAWGNATIDDLLDAVGDAAGRDLSGWAEGWLRRAGTDTLRVTDGRLTATGPDGDAPRPHRIDVAALVDDDGVIVPAATTRVEVAGEPVLLDLPAGALAVWPDLGDHTFAATRPIVDELRALTGRVADIADPTTRAQLLATWWDMMVAGETDAAPVVDAATALCRGEDGPALVAPALELATTAAEVWSTAAARPALVATVADCAADAVGRPALRAVGIRSLARTATTPEHLSVLEGIDDLPATADLDLAWRVAARRAQLGHDVTAALASLLERDTTGQRAGRQLTVVAGTPDPEAKESVWRTVVEERRMLSSTALTGIGRSFWRRTQSDLVERYRPRWVDAVAALEADDFWFSSTLARMAPNALVDEELIGLVTRALEQRDPSPSAVQTLTLTADSARRVLVARSRDVPR